MGKADATQPEIIRAIESLGLKYKQLSGTGDGIEDLLVLMPFRWVEQRDERVNVTLVNKVKMPAYWLFVECKCVERKSTGYVRYTKSQKEWREKTPDGPRITCVSFEDALRQLRDLLS